MTRETRSAEHDTRTLPLWPDLVPPAGAPSGTPQAGGVGARQRRRPARAGGGGYLNGRTPAELRADPRLRELSEIGLRSHWLALAELAGYDAFVAWWRLVSQDESMRDDSNQVSLQLRPFRAYERYQRNRYIDTLVMAGLKPSVIQAAVAQDLNEELTYQQIRRLAQASRARQLGEAQPASQSQSLEQTATRNPT
jgi:hypothetical protein